MTELVEPLYKLLDRKMKFEFKDEYLKTFEKLKSKWKTNLELKIPDMNGEFILESDASDTGIGAVLKQNGETVAYISRILNGAEKHYSITEKETLASIWAMERLEYFLIGKKFTLITDHKAVEMIKKKLEFGSNRNRRWFERFERFNFDVEYRRGEDMIEADALSRSAINLTNMDTTVENCLKEKVIKIHEENNHRKNIFEQLKDNNIDCGIYELKNILKECEVCARVDQKIGKKASYIKTSEPGEIVGADMLEVNLKERIIVMIDYFTRMIFAKLVTTKEAEKIVEFVKKFI
jgi:hypothetical protein